VKDHPKKDGDWKTYMWGQLLFTGGRRYLGVFLEL